MDDEREKMIRNVENIKFFEGIETPSEELLPIDDEGEKRLTKCREYKFLSNYQNIIVSEE